MSTATQVPHNLEIERCMLSCMMVSPSAAKGAFGAGIAESDFFDPRNVTLFGVFRSLAEEGKPLDYPLICNRCTTDEEVLWATDVFQVCFTGANWKYYAEVLREHTMGRKTITAARALHDAASTPTRLSELSTLVSEQLASIGSLAQPEEEETFESQMDAFVDALESREPKQAFAFGLDELDQHLGGGIHRGEVFVVGGPTGAGKSVLLCMSALKAAQAGNAVAIYSLEMPSDDLLSRMCSNVAGLKIKGVSDMPSQRELNATFDAIRQIRGMRFTIDTRRRNIADIERHVMKLASEGKADVVIVDYLQLVQTDEGETREQAVSSISRRLKNLAMGANVAIFTASQLNDDGRLRESRAIGQNADTVAIIDEKGNIQLDKNRRGPRDVSIPVVLRGAIARFEPL